ncbi:L-seryl-tRNA(Sec) selenium transferase [Clostridium massiliamazoniense]|uniref:L-seryl-tRNA(Sec) selenium transferase n=1 Tax=Clostridium massiliamazoniense TaxID=1347366 RepID=UPI0006D7A8BE|nr:L-seryl-tRNA(Sec) selenium transferase [Clostridium massiliamazoniense]
MKNELLRNLPKMDLLINDQKVKNLIGIFGRESILKELRETLDFYRRAILNEEKDSVPTIEEIRGKVENKLSIKKEPSIKRVINATGIVIHTNLGRSLLSENSIKAMINVARGYSNLEYNLKDGKRGSRHDHISNILKELTGAEDAVVVNNNAAAVMLVLNELSKNKEVIVSRGELVEIGGSFRVPEIMELSGSFLKEVGTTNRTHLSDYENAIGDNTSLLLKVHSSNFKIIGFTKEVSSEELASLGKKHNIITMEDLGSGILVDLSEEGFSESKTVMDVVKSGIDIITFSGDKLLGGPQAGIIVGKKEYIERLKKNQLMRALRVDKITLAALEATLMEYLNKESVMKEIPTLNMISLTKEELKKKALELKSMLDSIELDYSFSISENTSFVGGGSMPGEEITSYVIEIVSKSLEANEIEKSLREYKTPIISRINKGKVLLDVRTIKEDEYETILKALEERINK